MNTKKFTVVDTRTNRTKTIESSANTVGELKADLRANGINPDGMAIQEGLTKTELGDDSSYLPHDVPYKGGTTNNLVFRLTQREKRIKSGVMSRGEAFAKVKELGLQDTIVAKYGKNFTQCKTEILIAEIEAAENGGCKQHNEDECCTNVADALTLLVNKLVENGCLEEEDGEEIVGLIGTEVECSNTSEYSASEIDDMFSGM